MQREQDQVAEFMLEAKQELPPAPTIPSHEVRNLRLSLIGEEFIELANAFGYEVNFDISDISPRPDWTGIIHTADALADLLYVTLGTAVACGIDIDPIFQEVHRSNMTKFIDGTFRSDGKYMKGPNYSPADIKTLIERQMK